MHRALTAAVTVALVMGLAFSASAESQTSTAEKHLQAGLACTACHGSDKPGSVPMEKCLSCHGPYEALAKRTAQLPRNPHDSHFGELDCNECHHGHKPNSNYCGTCHPGN